MEEVQIRAVQLEKFGGAPIYTTVPKPVPKEGELLIKVEASTINPSDHIFIQGQYFPRSLPTTLGFEGVGRVQAANGAALQEYVGKRVSFTTYSGSWAEYAIPDMYFVIDDDVPLSSAASGIVNPLAALAMVSTIKTKNLGGAIHTAAASGLGKMLVRMCKTENLPLINIVRRKQQADLLYGEGAEHVIVTEGDWQPVYKELVRKLKVRALFDALGGGEVTQRLIEGLEQPANVYIYGMLANDLIHISPLSFFGGLNICGLYNSMWFGALPDDQKKDVIKNYSRYLKGDLATKTLKEFDLQDINEAIALSSARASEGKVLLHISAKKTQ